jgi:hypothetical protein
MYSSIELSIFSAVALYYIQNTKIIGFIRVSAVLQFQTSKHKKKHWAICQMLFLLVWWW